MTISFNSISNNLRRPGNYVEFATSRNYEGLFSLTYKALLFGQMTAAGTATALTTYAVTNAAQAKTLFGAGSQLAQMVEAWLNADDLTALYCIPLEDDDAAAAATGTITFSGTATEAGTLECYIGGRNVDAGISAGDAAADVATALAAAVNAEEDLAVTAAAAAGVVTLTAKNAGLAGCGIDVRVNYYDDEALPDGITCVVADMAGGTGDPDLDDLIAAWGDTWYNIMAMPYTGTANLKAVSSELEDRDGPTRMIDGHVFTACRGSYSELATIGSARNSKYETVAHIHGLPTTPWEFAATEAGVVSRYAQIDPARPFQTLELPGILAPAEADRFTLSENNLLLYDGISTFAVDAGDTVRIQRVISTYRTNSAGADDDTYLDVNTPLTIMLLRYDLRTLFANKYPRHKLADDGTAYGVGQAVITPGKGRSECIARYAVWERNGLVEDMDSFKGDLIVERNESDVNRLDFKLPVNLMNQFRVGAYQLAISL